MRAYATLVAALALACGASVQAAALTDYNVIILGNANFTGGDAAGSVAIGGNLTANGWPVFNGPVTVANSVSGQLTMNGGVLTYGSGSFQANLNSGASSHQAVSNIAQYSSIMHGVSTYYKNLTANSTNPDPNSNAGQTVNNPAFIANGGADNLAVFSLNANLLTNNKFGGNWHFSNVDSNDTVIMNVYSDTGVVNLNSIYNFGDTGFDGRIIWNFYNATSIDLSGLGSQFQGTILAPDAALTMNGKQINGNVYVASYSESGSEIHNYPYTGYVPTGSPPPVPEPATLGLLLPVVAGMLLRRAKH